MAHDSAAYCWSDFAPGSIQNHIAPVQDSGLTTVILWALHVGRRMRKFPKMRCGDLMFNDYEKCLLVSEGTFNPGQDDAIGAWPRQVAQLKQRGGVKKIYLSIGGASPPVRDFAAIRYMLDHGMSGTLKDNFTALRDAFKIDGTCVIDGIDLDSEEETKVTEQTMVDFSKILFDCGFEVTFCPYRLPDYWQHCMQALRDAGHEVSRWNLQCYSGGFGNRADLQSWIDALVAVAGPKAAARLFPGLAVAGPEFDGQCPTGEGSVCETFAGWKDLGLPGGFLWRYDDIRKPNACAAPVNLAAYVSAINDGLDNKRPSAGAGRATRL
jgi:hypothetical protein